METLGDEPTVIAMGTHARNMLPLSALLRRNRHLALIKDAVARCRTSGQAVTDAVPGDRIVRVHPVAMDGDGVYGAHVWFGPTDTTPPPRPPAGAHRYNAQTCLSTPSREALTVLGISPDQPVGTRTVAEELASILPNPREAEMLTRAVDPDAGDSYCMTCPAVDYRGTQFLLHFAGRVSIEPDDEGRQVPIARSVNTRVEPNSPGQEPRLHRGLAHQILDAIGVPGAHRALVSARDFTLLKWIDDPLPGLHWQYDPRHPASYHPGDQDAVADMLHRVCTDAVRTRLRLRGNAEDWISVQVSARKVMITAETPAVLVTMSRE